MQLISFVVLSVLCAFSEAITFSTLATVSLTLINLNKPVSCFFGIFRRRKSPPIEETIARPQADASFAFAGVPMSGGLFNPFGGFGAGGMFYPGLNTNPGFGMFGNRFPPQFKPPQMPVQKPPQLQRPAEVPQRFPSEQNDMPQFPQQHMMQQFPPQHMRPVVIPSGMDVGNFRDPREEYDVPGMNTEEAESFFTLLSETDESKCISRLVCEMGANPESGGEFGETIVEIISSLKDFPDGSKVSEYNEVLNIGLAEGLSACMSKFSVCDEESFQLVKKAQLDDEGQSK